MTATARRGNTLHTTINLLPGLSGLPERLRGKRLIMASAFEVYVDDSGSEPQSPIFFLAGFISSVERWAALSNEWDTALGLHPTLDYFKMSEAAGFWEQFSRKRGWNEINRDDRLVTFARIINKYAMFRVSASIRHDFFEKYLLSLPAIERNLAVDSPYIMLAMHFISGATLFAYNKGIREPIDFIFDEQTGFKEELRESWPAYKRLYQLTSKGRQLAPLLGAEPTFLDEKDRKPLQAADLYAWQTRDHYVQNHRFNNQKIIVPMNATLKLLRGVPMDHFPMKEPMLIRQHAALVQAGERIKKNDPSIKLIPAATDRKERRKIRRQTKRQKRKKHNYFGFSLVFSGEEMILLNARSKTSASSASTALAVSMNRFDCSGSSGFGATLCGIIYFSNSPLIHCGFEAEAHQVNLVGNGVRCKENIPKKSASYSSEISIAPFLSTGLPKLNANKFFRQSKLKSRPGAMTAVVPFLSPWASIPPPPSHATSSKLHVQCTLRMAKR